MVLVALAGYLFVAQTAQYLRQMAIQTLHRFLLVNLQRLFGLDLLYEKRGLPPICKSIEQAELLFLTRVPSFLYTLDVNRAANEAFWIQFSKSKDTVGGNENRRLGARVICNAKNSAAFSVKGGHINFAEQSM